MNRYPEYKDSGIEWIGEIPKHWIESRVKHRYQVTLGKMLTSQNRGDMVVARYLRSQNVQDGFLDLTDVKEMWFSFSELEKLRLKSGDLLVNEGGQVGRSALWNSAFDSCCFQNSLNRVRTSSGCITFTFHLFQMYFHVGYFDSVVDRVSIPHLTREKLIDIKLPLPPYSEQVQISEYLDQRTSQIDSLIEKFKKKIQLLKEYRVALISQCVTKGLDPEAEMKDSGIEWIGEIPKDWEISRLAVMGAFSKGSMISKGDLIPDGHPCILYGELYTKFDRKVSATHSRIPDDLFKSSKTVNNGTFLFTASGETADEIGKCVLVLCNEFVAIGGDSTIFRLFNENEFDVEYLSYALNSEYCRVFKAANSRGEIVVHIYGQQLKNLRVVYPSIQAQKTIRQHLDNRTVKIDSLVEKLKKKIELLKEYRQSLISNVVTGKIRVTEQTE